MIQMGKMMEKMRIKLLILNLEGSVNRPMGIIPAMPFV